MEELSVESIVEYIKDRNSFGRDELASIFGVSPDDIDFKLKLNEARNVLVSRAVGIDFKPTGRGGRYERASHEQTLDRSDRDQSAAMKKLTRSLDKRNSVAASADDDKVRAVAQRKAGRLDQTISWMRSAARKRNIPTPGKEGSSK